MDQYLLANITKSHSNDAYVKGPSYDLDLVSIQKIAGFLKSKNLWNNNFLFETNAFIDNAELFERLNIFETYVIEENYRYSLEFGDIKNYFTPGLPLYNEGYKHLVINARDKENGIKYFTRFLDKDYQDLFLEKFSDVLRQTGSVSLVNGDIAQISVDPDVNFMFEFNFSKYNHVLEFEDPWNYIIKPGEEWMAIQEETI
jgi:hypothetical protein